MSTNFHTLTAFSAVTFGLFSVLISSACDAPEDPDPIVMWSEANDEEGSDSPLDWADSPALQAPPEDFYIENVKTNGKGCPAPDSVLVQMSPDESLLRIVYYDMFLAQWSDQGIQATSCTTTLKLHVPDGWRVAPGTVRTRGYTDLDEDIKARRHTNMFFAGMPVGVKFNTNFQGPHKGIYQANDVVPPAATAWSSCGGAALFSITNSLILNPAANPEGDGLFTLYDQRLVSWQFKPC